MVDRIVMKCNLYYIRIGKCLSAVCLIVFGLKQKDASLPFVFKSTSVYAIM